MGHVILKLRPFALVCGLVATMSCSDAPPSSDTKAVGDVQSMQRRSDGLFDVICTNGAHETVSEAEILGNRVCLGGSGGSGSFVYGRSDSCGSSDIVAEVNEQTNCQLLSSTDVAWSIKVRGVCSNISDTNVRHACELIKAETSDVIYGRSDSCSSDDIVTTVSPLTDCSSLSATDISWSIKVGGTCRNISDTNVRSACFQVKDAAGGHFVYGRSDSCEMDSIIAEVTRLSDCNTLSNTDIAWSIKANGTCRNIADTNLRAACFQVKEVIR